MFEDCNMVILKITKGCNLRCKYCYIKDKDHYDGPEYNMSFDTLKKVFDRILLDKQKIIEAKYIKASLDNKSFNHNETITIVLHGGEPTYVGYEYLNKILTYMHNRSKNFGHIKVKFSMQTNATLLTDELLELLSLYNVSVGLSFDGAELTSNTARTSKSADFYKETVKKLRAWNLNPNILMVVNKNNIDYLEENAEILKKEFGIEGFKMNYVEDVLNLGDLESPGDDYFNKIFKKNIDLYLDGTISCLESNISDMVNTCFQGFVSGNIDGRVSKKGNCYIRFCGAGSHIIEVDPDGTFNRCGRYSESDDMSTLGNLTDFNPFNAKVLPKLVNFAAEKDNALRKLSCDYCLARDICDYGCMAFHYAKTGEFGIREDLVCSYFKKAKQYMLLNISAIFKKIYKIDSYSVKEPIVLFNTYRDFYPSENAINLFNTLGLTWKIRSTSDKSQNKRYEFIVYKKA